MKQYFFPLIILISVFVTDAFAANRFTRSASSPPTPFPRTTPSTSVPGMVNFEPHSPVSVSVSSHGAHRAQSPYEANSRRKKSGHQRTDTVSSDSSAASVIKVEPQELLRHREGTPAFLTLHSEAGQKPFRITKTTTPYWEAKETIFPFDWSFPRQSKLEVVPLEGLPKWKELKKKERIAVKKIAQHNGETLFVQFPNNPLGAGDFVFKECDLGGCFGYRTNRKDVAVTLKVGEETHIVPIATTPSGLALLKNKNGKLTDQAHLSLQNALVDLDIDLSRFSTSPPDPPISHANILGNSLYWRSN